MEELIQALDSRGVREGGLLPALLRAQPELAAAQPAGPILCALLLSLCMDLAVYAWTDREQQWVVMTRIQVVVNSAG